jgi:hypothetical protein
MALEELEVPHAVRDNMQQSAAKALPRRTFI